jgi:replicative superfamily II helicase
MNEIIYENMMRILKMGKQIIIFCHKRAETYSTATEIVDLMKEKNVFERHRDLFIGDQHGVKREVD